MEKDDKKNGGAPSSPQGEGEEKSAEAADELEKCRKQSGEYLDGWKRAKADLLNYKKDELKRLEEIAKFANDDLMRELIVVLDSFDLSLAVADGGEKGTRGALMIRAQLEDTLKKRGLERVAVLPGDKFNPAVHEAIAETDGEGEPGTVAEEIERGYSLRGRVIRPARVRLFK